MAKPKYFGIPGFAIPFSFGNAGVEFFFVLSGFIIFSAHRKDIFQPWKLGSYLEKRFTRIYPTFWVVFLGVLILAYTSSASRSTIPRDWHVIAKAALLLPQDPEAVGSLGSPILVVAWTLQYEVFFYAFFALLILNRWLSMAAGLLLLGTYIVFHGVAQLTFPLAFFLKDYVLLFAMGMAVSLGCIPGRSIAVDRPLLFGAIGTGMFALIALDTVLKVGLLGDHNVIPYGLASSLIVFGVVQSEDRGRIIGGYKWLQILGDSSYALYLIHFPMISVLCKLTMLVHLNELGVVGALIGYGFVVATCLISAVAFHLWIEVPLIQCVKGWWPRSRLATR